MHQLQRTEPDEIGRGPPKNRPQPAASPLPNTPGVVPSGGYASRSPGRTALQVPLSFLGRGRGHSWDAPGPTARPAFSTQSLLLT
jgi:hypothetical protein